MPPATVPRERLPAIRTANHTLIRSLESHPSFASQHSARRGKIYFIWDFAQRSEAMFKALIEGTAAPDTPATRGVVPPVEVGSMTARQRRELENDAVGRCVMLHTLITDTTGMSAMMFQERPGEGVDVGAEVRRRQRRLWRLLRPLGRRCLLEEPCRRVIRRPVTDQSRLW
ncbi:uncharacterized protein EI97DRAFT_463349, partial [Westerdykella ornata]